jgi:hypothetical protein
VTADWNGLTEYYGVKQDFADGSAEPTNAIGRERKGEITDDLARSTNEFKQRGGDPRTI